LSRVAPGPAAAALAVAALVVVLARGSGGYFPSDWGLALLACALLAAGAVLVRDRLDAGLLDAAFAGGLLAFVGWTALSALWADSAGPPVEDAERALVYAAAAAALALAVPRDAVDAVALGVFAAAVAICLYGLVAHLFPGELGRAYDPAADYQVDQPIGYANAMGIVAVVGLLLALGLALHGGAVVRVVAGAATVPLAATLVLTFSRGSLVALALALPVLVLLEAEPREPVRRAALLLVPAAAGVVVALRTPDVFEPGRDLATASDGGRRLAVVLAALTVVAGALAVPRPRLRRRAVVGAAALAAALAVATVLVGGPVDVVSRAADAFAAETPSVTRDQLGRQLLTASGNRPEYWRVALDVARAHPLAGSGGGTYERAWLRERPIDESVRNAHSLYLETLAELGAVGLVLLLAALAVPVAAVARAGAAGRRPVVPSLAAAYAASLVHAGVDWDWEVPAVTILAVACGGALVVAARTGPPVGLAARRRAAALAVLAPVVAVALVVHVGNRAVAAGEAALLRDDPAAAASSARRAIDWLPWSAEGRLLLGEAELAAGDTAAARVSIGRALERDAGDWSAWYLLAAASRGVEARAALARAAELNPRSPDVAELRAGS
jgi:hypothetical protein